MGEQVQALRAAVEPLIRASSQSVRDGQQVTQRLAKVLEDYLEYERSRRVRSSRPRPGGGWAATRARTRSRRARAQRQAPWPPARPREVRGPSRSTARRRPPPPLDRGDDGPPPHSSASHLRDE
ncbi:MAG: hypothetical protein R3F62_20405 [Planctomycetota bacterium]